MSLIITPSGGTSTAPGTYYSHTYYPNSTSNYWSLTSATDTDFTVTGTIPSPTVLVNPNFGTISKATSNLPGINFSAPRTGVIKVTCIASAQPSNNATAAVWDIVLLESTTSTTLFTATGAHYGSGTVGIEYPITLIGYFSATASTTYNFKLKGATASGTMFIGAYSATGSCLSFSMEYIT